MSQVLDPRRLVVILTDLKSDEGAVFGGGCQPAQLSGSIGSTL